MFRSLLSSRGFIFLLLIFWMSVIFFFSSLSGKEAAGPPTLAYYLERKGAHVFEYAVLMFLSFRYLHLCFYRETISRLILSAGAFALMYGATDELHQYFVPLRGARMSDVLIDGLGILLAAIVIALFYRNKNRPK